MQHSHSIVRSSETVETSSIIEGTRCPQFECSGRMQFITTAEIVPFIGLQQVCCTHCDHLGMVSPEGVQLLFRGGHEYLFSYGHSVKTLIVVLTAHAVDVFRSHGLGPDILAKRAAEWALLKGQCAGTVHLPVESAIFAEFYRHYCCETGSLH